MTKTLLTTLALLTLATSCYADSTGTPGQRPNSHLDRQQCWRDGGEVKRHTPSDRYYCDIDNDRLTINELGQIARPDYWMEDNHTDFDFEAYAATSTTTTTTTTEAASSSADAMVCVTTANTWTRYTRNGGAFGLCLAAVDYDDAPIPPVLHIDCGENRTIRTAILTPYPLTHSDDDKAIVEWWQKSNPTQGGIETWFTDETPQSGVTPQNESVFLYQIAAIQTGELIINFISVDDYDPEADNPAGVYTATFDVTGADRHIETISQECQ